MTSIKGLERYLEKVFDWSARVASLQDGRCFAQVPLRQVFEAVFWGTVLRHKSLHSIEAECREGVLRRRIGPVSESTVGYALERMKVQSLRELSFAVTRKLKRNGVLQWATAGGQLVVALDGIEVFCSERRRCAKCSVRTKRRGEEQVQEYYHRVVVASLVGFGFRLVVDLELVEPGENEVGAGERVLRRMVQHLGRRFFQIVVADALYANAPFLHTVQRLGLDLVATLKDNQSDLLAQAKGRMDRPPDQTFQRDAQTHYAIWEEENLWWDVARESIRVIQVQKQRWVTESVGGNKQRRLQSGRQFYLTTCSPRRISARSIGRVGEVRWELETSTFSHATTEYGIKHAQVHSGKPQAFLALLCIRLLAISLYMIYVCRQVWSHYRHEKPSLKLITDRFYRNLARNPKAWAPG